jgi:hypothetical protein
MGGVLPDEAPLKHSKSMKAPPIPLIDMKGRNRCCQSKPTDNGLRYLYCSLTVVLWFRRRRASLKYRRFPPRLPQSRCTIHLAESIPGPHTSPSLLTMSTVCLSSILMSALIEDTDVAEGVRWAYAQENFLGVELSVGSSEATIVALAHISATPQDGSVRYDADVHLNSETIGEIDETFEVLAFQHLGPKLEAWREAWSSRLDDFKEVGPALKQLHQAVHQSFVAASQSDQGRTLNTKVYDSLNPEHREFFKDPEHVSVTRGTTPSARGTDPYLMVVQSIVLEMEGGSATRSEEPGRMIMTVTPGIRIALGAKDELNVSSSHSMFRDCTESWDNAKMEGLYPTTELWKKLNDQIDKKPLLDLIRANDPTATTTASKSLREAYRRKTVKLALEYSMTDKSAEPEPLTRSKSNLRRAYTTRNTSNKGPRRWKTTRDTTTTGL